MRTVTLWQDRVPEREKFANVIWSMAFKPDGAQVVVAAGNRVLVYDATDGDLIHSLKGHKDAVFAVAYSRHGKKFASGGADKQVIIWTQKAEGILKYNHNESIQCLAYNPVTQQLASGTATDLGLWSPEQKSVSKHKVSSKVLCMSWTSDGLHLALGLFNGHVSIRDKFGVEKADMAPSKAPIWCLAWNPQPPKSDPTDVLVVGSWDKALYFYKVSGQECMKEQKLTFDPCAISFFTSGEHFVLAGSGKKVQLWTREGIFLGNIAEKDDWVWSLAIKPRLTNICVGCNAGTVTMYQIIFSTVHGLYQDRYAYREAMTDVIIQHLVTEQKVRIRCKDYVKKISVYRDRLAVQIPERVLIYEVSHEDPLDMHYKNIEKIKRRFECSLLVVTANHIILCQEKKLQLFSFQGVLEREWLLDSLVRYIKVIGGASLREGLLVGLKNGHVIKVFIDNPFPVTLIKQETAVRCLDLSCNRKKLAVVDETANLLVYNLENQKLLYTEPQANSVAWNSEMEDMVAYSGQNMLSIKTGDFPPHSQKLQGFVVGFKGSKIFCLHYVSMQTIDVPQSSALYRYMEKKDFLTGYKVACLGVTDNDWRQLAIAALQNLEFQLARKCFIRIRDVRYIDLLNKICQTYGTSKLSSDDEQLITAQVLAFQGKFKDAANAFVRAKKYDLAMEMYTDLRKWEEAKHYATMSEKQGGGGKPGTVPREGVAHGLMLKQASHSEQSGDIREAGEMYKQAGQFKKAVEIFCKIGSLDLLIDVVRELHAEKDKVLLQMAAKGFRLHQHHAFARETIIKLGDIEALISLHMESNRWEEAFHLGQQYPEYSEQIYLPWAEWLAKNDRFEEASDAYKKAKRVDLALNVVEQLANSAIIECRFKDASVYYWRLAQNVIAAVTEKTPEAIECFWELRRRADIMAAYASVYAYIKEPFTTLMPEHVFHVSLYLWNITGVPSKLAGYSTTRLISLILGKNTKDMEKIDTEEDPLNSVLDRKVWNAQTSLCTLPVKISRVHILYALGKQAVHLKAFKLARIVYEKLQSLVVPQAWGDQIDQSCLILRAKPYNDQDPSLSPVCSRCMTTNALLRFNNDVCTNCGHPFVRTALGFDILPVVEFVPYNSLGVDGERLEPLEVRKYLQKEPKGGNGQGGRDGWAEGQRGDANVLCMDDDFDRGDNDLFMQKVVDAAVYFVPGEPYQPVKIDVDTLISIAEEDVFICEYSKISSRLEDRYFKCMIAEFPLAFCDQCFHFFHEESWEVEFLRNQLCPFCNLKPTNMN